MLQPFYRYLSLNHTDQLSCPLIVFQGLEDRIVPPNQGELIVEALPEYRALFAGLREKLMTIRENANADL